jgi:ATP-dependent DNA ligase
MAVEYDATWCADFLPVSLQTLKLQRYLTHLHPGWIHEIKHDGFRIIAYRNGNAVRLLTRNGGVV